MPGWRWGWKATASLATIPPMSAAPKGGILAPVLIAAILSLAITAVRLYGELHGWDPKVFSTEGGGGGSPLGITWLVPVFGFWFGRRLTKNGHRPKSIATTLCLCVLGIALAGGIAYAAFGTEWLAAKGDWVRKAMFAFPGAAVCGLLLLIAWPRGWGALALYGILARIPVLVIQHFAFANDWRTHFNSGGPEGPQDPATLNVLLLYAEGAFWPFGFTVLVGGIFAVLGALTVRKP